MKRVRVLLVLAMFVLALAGAAITSAEGPVTVQLNPQNDSGESGTAILTDLGNGKVRVEVEVTGAPADVPQPLHIHEGTCANLTAKPTFPLTAAVNGKSLTEIETTLAALQGTQYAINGHKSAAEASVYVFCGDIPMLAANTLPATGGEFTNGIMLLAGLGALILLAGFVMWRKTPDTI